MQKPVSFERLLVCALLCAALFLAGCGGGSSPATKQASKGRASFVIHWPLRTKVTSRLIPAAADLVRIQITAQTGSTTTTYGTQDAVRPHVDGQPDLTAPTTAVTFNNLPPGSFNATLTAYPANPDIVTGTIAQATASAPVTIVAGQTAATNITMGSTITQVLAPAFVSAVHATNHNTPFQFTVQPKAKDGNIVLVGSTLQVTYTGSPGPVVLDKGNHVYAVDSDGGLGAGDVTVKETESSVTSTFHLSFDPYIYIADRNNNRIVRVDDRSGDNPIALGALGSGVGQFNLPNSVTVDSQGRVYVADGGNSRIVRINDITRPAIAAGNWTALPASLPNGVNTLNTPYGVAIDHSGRIYIGDTGNNRVVRVDDMSGSNAAFFDGFGGNQNFSQPNAIAFDSQNHPYIADYNNSRVVRLNAFPVTGSSDFTSFPTVSGAGVFNIVQGVAIASQDRIYVADRDNQRIARMNDINGSGLFYFPASPGTSVFTYPVGINFDTAGRIYISGNGTVTRIDDMTGANLVQVGGFNNPFGIAVY